MSAFSDLIANMQADKSYLVTVRPSAFVRDTTIAAAATGNKYTAPEGTFLGLMYLDKLQVLGFSTGGNNGTVTVTEVASDGSSITVTGLTLTTEAAGNTCTLFGEVVRYYSSHGLTTKPAESPANTWYDPRIENALQFTRSMVNGDRIGGKSIPGFGSVTLKNADGVLDGMRSWGWSGRSIRVELGGPLFERADYGIIFDGLTEAAEYTDNEVTIRVTDLQGLLEKPLWRPVYLGTGGLEGGVDIKGLLKPLAYGPVRNADLVFIGIVDGRFVYQFHDGQVGAYDAAFHLVRDSGNPLTYAASNPIAGQWTLDATNGCIILGGNPIGTITADVKGSAEGSYVSSTATIIQRIAQTRLALQADISTTSIAIGTGSKTIFVPTTMPFGVGCYAFIAKEDDSDNYWMFGDVTAFNSSTGELTVNVTRTAGVGTYGTWLAMKVGLLTSELDAASFTALEAANSALNCTLVRPDDSPIQIFDQLINAIGGYYGFTRAGLFQVGRLDAPTGATVLDIDGDDCIELKKDSSKPPTWRMQWGYKKNWHPLTGNDLAAEIRENVVTNGTFDSGVGWTTGAGWTIAASKATATAGSATDLSRTINILNTVYVLQFDITVTAGSLTPKIGASAVGAAITTTQTIKRDFTGVAGATTIVFSKDASFAGDIDNVSITVKEKAFLETEYRYTDPVSDGIVRAVHGPIALSEKVASTLDADTAAVTERDRQFALHNVSRDVFSLLMKSQPFQLDVGQLVSLDDRRFGLSTKLMRVLAVDENAGDTRTSLVLWG